MLIKPLKFARQSPPLMWVSLISLVFVGSCASNKTDQITTGSISSTVNESIHDARDEEGSSSKSWATPKVIRNTYSSSSYNPDEIHPDIDYSLHSKGYEAKSYFQKNSRNSLALKDVIEFTLATNPELGIADAQVEDARIGVEIEKADYHPQVDLSLSAGLENTYTSSTTAKGVDRSEANVTVRQTLFDFGAISSAVDRRRALHQSASLRKTDAQEQIVFDVLKSYLNYLRQTDLVTSSAKNVAAHKKIAKLVRLSQKGGNATVADVKRVETRLDAANSQKISNDNALKDANAAFKRITELNPSRIKRPRKLIPTYRAIGRNAVSSKILQNPKLKSLAADRASLEQQLKQQRATVYPKLFALGEANYKSNVAGETGVTRDAKGMLVLQVKLFDGGRKQKTAQQIEQRILEADSQHQKLYRELTQNFEQNKQVLLTNRKKASYLKNGFNAAKKVTSLYTQQFRAGTRSPFELLDAQRDLHRAEQEVINHRYDSALAGYNELRLRGELVASLVN